MGKIWLLNVGCADTTVIDTANTCIMIDCHNPDVFSNYLPTNKKIRAMFITHQHYDHFDCMKYLIDNEYDIEYLIYSPYDRRYGDNSVDKDEWTDFNNYAAYFVNNGTEVYKPYRQEDFSKPWWNIDGLRIWMIGPEKNIASSDTREIHDASLVFTVKSEKRTCLFTGDASDASLNWIAKNTNNHCNDILHASHHGSLNGADLEFIKSCKIVHTIISTKSGEHESVPHPTALARYDNHSEIVYRTDVSGTLSYNF